MVCKKNYMTIFVINTKFTDKDCIFFEFLKLVKTSFLKWAIKILQTNMKKHVNFTNSLYVFKKMRLIKIIKNK